MPSAPTFEISVLSEHHLQALVSLSGAAAAAHDFTEVLDLAADAARGALGVDSLSVSRWEADAGVLRTLIVSEEGLAEAERHPAEETYLVTDFPLLVELLTEGKPHVTLREDPDAHPVEKALLEELGMASSAAVPIVYEDRVWGELYVATRPGRPDVSAADVTFLQAVAAQLAVALGRAERFSQVSRAAYEDQLTGLANRRAFEDGLVGAVEAANESGAPLTLVMGDLNGLKETNDTAGHEAGDEALRAVARALRDAAGEEVLAARVGGDEFCALLPGARVADGEALVERMTEALAAHDPPLRVAWGVACLGGAVVTARDLFRAADEVQYAVKRRGTAARGRRAAKPLAAETADVLATCLDALDAAPHADRLDRTTAVARELAAALHSPRWIVVRREKGSDEIQTLLVCDHRIQEEPVADGTRRPATTFPTLQRLLDRPGTAFVTREAAPASERMLLDALGLLSVAGGSAATPDGLDALVLYGDERTLPLAPAAPLVRALLAAV